MNEDVSTVSAVLVQGRGPNFATAIESLMARAEDPKKRKTVFFSVTITSGPLKGRIIDLDVRINVLERLDETPDDVMTLGGRITKASYKDGGASRLMSCTSVNFYDYDAVKKTAKQVVLDI